VAGARPASAFGGVEAEIRSSGTGRIVAVVPPAAATGPLRVSAGASSVAAEQPFLVVDQGPPEVTGIAPRLGESGTVVVLSGRRLVTDVGDVAVSFIDTPARVLSAENGTLRVEVPAPAASGRLRVESPYGTTEAVDFFWVPPPYRTADVAATARTIAPAAATVEVPTGAPRWSSTTRPAGIGSRT
jgi:hypothetical protein